MNYFIQTAHAAPEATTASTEVAAGAEKSEGLSIQPTTVAFQALNLLILLIVLHKILYKPLLNIMQEREKKIRDGVENAEKAEVAVHEANLIRQDILKNAKGESQSIVENARKSGEEVKTGIVNDAHQQAEKIIQSGHNLVEMEKAKTMDELKHKTVNLVIMAAEKVLREKIDASRDAKMIEENLKSYSL